MKADDLLLEYIINNNKNSLVKTLIENKLFLIFGNKLNLGEEYSELYNKLLAYNKVFDAINKKEISEVTKAFILEGIIPIYFKGVILGTRLYRESYYRSSGDIDVWVQNVDFDKGIRILNKLGYSFIYDDHSSEDKHHVVLGKKDIVLELHRHFIHPDLMIDEEYLSSHTENISVLDSDVKTLSISATYLHLIYHLYMDYCWTRIKQYDLVVDRKLPEVRLFLYRTYELALFEEKYWHDIKWHEVKKEIKKQVFKNELYLMVSDIRKIYPEIFRNILNENEIKYNTDYSIYYYIRKKSEERNNISRSVSEYINHNWELYPAKKTIDLSNAFRKYFCFDDQFNCYFESLKGFSGLKFSFTVNDKDVVTTVLNEMNPDQSDGVHLIIAGSKEFSYLSLFFFPKKHDGTDTVLIEDCLLYRKFTSNEIIAKSKIKDNGYLMEILFTYKFLANNRLFSPFYFNAIIASCDSKSRKRGKEIVINECENEWYTPERFIKINY